MSGAKSNLKDILDAADTEFCFVVCWPSGSCLTTIYDEKERIVLCTKLEHGFFTLTHIIPLSITDRRGNISP